MLRRLGLFMMLLLAGWLPLQSVAAWQMMTQVAFTPEQMTSSMLSEHDTTVALTSASCHSGTMVMDDMHTMSDTTPTASHQHQDAHCLNCLSLCSGFPSSFSILTSAHPFRTPLHIVMDTMYSDAYPATIERPPRVITA